MLQVKDIDAYYGGIHALRNVSITIRPGEIVALIGANGAGKTTLLNVISGIIRAKWGRVMFVDQDITHFPPEKIVQMGIGQVPEGRQVFNPLTVVENLELGAYLRYKRRDKRAILEDMEYVFELFPILKERRNQATGTLSGGEQQMLSIGRTLMGRPKLILMDEPSLGLAPLLAREIFRVTRQLNEEGTTVLLVEQNAKAALKISHRAYVMETGQVVLEGLSRELSEDEEVKRAYLGRGPRERRS
ncbi:MAG: ABC transporter ATP-binding protein [Thermodesulfobacteriota bacterium]